MLFSANIAVEQGVVVAAIVIALFIFTCRSSLTQWLVSWSSPVRFQKYESKPKEGGEGSKNGSRRGDPNRIY